MLNHFVAVLYDSNKVSLLLYPRSWLFVGAG